MRAPFARLPRSGVNCSLVLLTIGAAWIGPGVAIEGAAAQRPRRAVLAADPSPYAIFIAEAAHRFGLPAAWIRAVIACESRGDPHAVSSAGAVGLMQLMPSTWQFERAHLALGSDPFDARDNILAGSDYLRAMHDRYGAIGMLAAYNAGPGRYDAYRHGDRPLPIETLAYVRRLAPVVMGDASVITPTDASADPLAWMRSPLFVARSTAKPMIALVAGAAPHSAQSDSDDHGIPATNSLRINDSQTSSDQPVDSVFVALGGDPS